MRVIRPPQTETSHLCRPAVLAFAPALSFFVRGSPHRQPPLSAGRGGARARRDHDATAGGVSVVRGTRMLTVVPALGWLRTEREPPTRPISAPCVSKPVRVPPAAPGVSLGAEKAAPERESSGPALSRWLRVSRVASLCK